MLAAHRRAGVHGRPFDASDQRGCGSLCIREARCPSGRRIRAVKSPRRATAPARPTFRRTRQERRRGRRRPLCGVLFIARGGRWRIDLGRHLQSPYVVDASSTGYAVDAIARRYPAEGTFALPAGPLRAPCDLPVEIAAGGLTVFGKRFELPIAGPGLVRVLYHDSTMRIFESPLTSQDKWEESGLVVVQVRESAVINS